MVSNTLSSGVNLSTLLGIVFRILFFYHWKAIYQPWLTSEDVTCH